MAEEKENMTVERFETPDPISTTNYYRGGEDEYIPNYSDYLGNELVSEEHIRYILRELESLEEARVIYTNQNVKSEENVMGVLLKTTDGIWVGIMFFEEWNVWGEIQRGENERVLEEVCTAYIDGYYYRKDIKEELEQKYDGSDKKDPINYPNPALSEEEQIERSKPPETPENEKEKEEENNMKNADSEAAENTTTEGVAEKSNN